MTGHREFHWNEEEVGRLQRYLKAGGTLFADACCGRMSFDMGFRRELAKVIEAGPEQAGYVGNCWHSPMIQQLILERFVLPILCTISASF